MRRYGDPFALKCEKCCRVLLACAGRGAGGLNVARGLSTDVEEGE